MIRFPSIVCALILAACTARPDTESLSNENQHLHGIVEEQQHQIDTLTTDKVGLDRRVKELEAQLSKIESTEKVVEKAKDEISESVRQVMERFRGDSSIEVERAPGGYRFVLREAVLFESAKAELTVEGRRTLQRVADTLRGGSERINIEGHTDDVPVKKPETMKKFPRGNMDLSVGRALAVWDYFAGDGKIEAERLSIRGFGPHRPRVPNTSQTNRWRNRRVEIHVEDR